MPGKPGWRGDPSGGTSDAFPLVIDPKLPLLPLHDLPWERFEELVLDIVREEEDPVVIQPYGLRGQKQHGIDIVAKQASGDWHVYQTRRVKDFRVADWRNIADAFVAGPRPFEARRLVVATSCDRVPTQLQEAIFDYGRAHPTIEFDQIWDAGELNRKLRRLRGSLSATSESQRRGGSVTRTFCSQPPFLRDCLFAKPSTRSITTCTRLSGRSRPRFALRGSRLMSREATMET